MRAPLTTGIAAAVCAAATSLPAPALATPTASTPSGSPSGTPSTPVTPPPTSALARAALVQTPSGPSSSGQLSPHDKTFLIQAAQTDEAEIVGGRLAINRAASTSIRSFGQRMVTDHSRLLGQTQALARSYGVTLPTTPGPQNQDLTKIWTQLRGGPFDCSYAPTVYAGHALAVHLWAYEAKQAHDPRIRQLAANQLPVLRQHLQLATKNIKNLNCSAPPPSTTPS